MSIPLPVLAIAIPLAAGILVLIVPRALRWVHETLAALATTATLALAVILFLRGAPDVRLPLLEVGGFSLSLDLVPSALGSLMLLFAAGFGFLVALYSLPAMASSGRRRQFCRAETYALARYSASLSKLSLQPWLAPSRSGPAGMPT